MDFSRVVESRCSVRHFRRDEVPRDIVERVIHAATLAPSSHNAQPWRFHVTTGASRQSVGELLSQATVHLAEYMDVLGPKGYEDARVWYSSLGDAPVVIVVSTPGPGSGLDLTNKLLSIGASTENLMLAAADAGLGSCVVTFVWWIRNELAELLALPEGEEVVEIIALGYPDATPPARPARRADVVEWLD